MPKCPFCNLDESTVLYADRWLAVRDAFPVSPGHTLLVPRRHVVSYFDLEDAEQRELHTCLDILKRQLDAEFHPDGYNIGINDGAAAGQTVMHLHVHVIPRYEGDVADPRGGIRWVKPDEAVYWEDGE